MGRAFIWTRLVPPEGAAGTTVQRAGWFSRYVAEAIAEDALRAGRGARLEVTVAPDASDAELTGVREGFAWLAGLGVLVRVGRDEQPDAERFYPSRAA
jgi:hypothetical protein